MTTYNFEIQDELDNSLFDHTLKTSTKTFKENSNSFDSYSLNDIEINAIFFGLEKICQIPLGMTDQVDIEKIKNYKKIAQKLLKQYEIMLENGLISIISIIGSIYPEVIEYQLT